MEKEPHVDDPMRAMTWPLQQREVSRRTVLKGGIGVLGALSVGPVVGLLEACGAPSASAPTSTTKVSFRMSSSATTGENSSHWVWYDRFSKALDKRTAGRVTIDYFPNSQLGQEAQIVEQVKLGTVDIMISGSSIWSNVVPELGALDIGYIFQSWDGVAKALDGSAGQQLSKLLHDKSSVEVLGWSYNFGARNVCTKKVVKSADDLRGTKLRVLPAPNVVATLKLMGAVPTPMAFGEIYTSLQTGVVEGLEHDAPTILNSKFYEIAKNIALTQHIFNPLVAVIGTTAMGRLPSDLKQPFMDAAKEATTAQRGLAVDTERRAMQTLQQNGVTVSQVDRTVFKNLVRPLWDDFTSKQPTSKPILDAVVKAQGTS
jgi:TRAP-type transport system periplasmic protein